jgi:hypothetical protein
VDLYRTYSTTYPGGVKGFAFSPLIYRHETFGVNLAWGTRPLPYDQWEFIKQPGHYLTQQIGASDHVALYPRCPCRRTR